MSNFFTHMRKAKNAAINKSLLRGRMQKYDLLKDRLNQLYDQSEKGEITITPMQKSECDRLRLEYSRKSRELMELYMQKELEVLEDLGNKFGYEVDTYENAAKEKLQLNK